MRYHSAVLHTVEDRKHCNRSIESRRYSELPQVTLLQELCCHTYRLGLLDAWREKHGERATYRELAKAFYDAGRLTLVDEVCNVVRAQDQPQPDEQGIKYGFLHLLIIVLLCFIVRTWDVYAIYWGWNQS